MIFASFFLETIPDSRRPNPDCIVKMMKALVKIHVASSEPIPSTKSPLPMSFVVGAVVEFKVKFAWSMFVGFDLGARKAFNNCVKVISGDQTSCLQSSSLYDTLPTRPHTVVLCRLSVIKVPVLKIVPCSWLSIILFFWKKKRIIGSQLHVTIFNRKKRIIGSQLYVTIFNTGTSRAESRRKRTVSWPELFWNFFLLSLWWQL